MSQTIAGHIYLCTNGNPTTTEQSGGTLAASGPTTVSATPNPLAPTQVNAGGYTMTATATGGVHARGLYGFVDAELVGEHGHRVGHRAERWCRRGHLLRGAR